MNLILAHAVFAEKAEGHGAVNRSSSEFWNATGKCRIQEAATERDPGSGSLESIIHSDGWRGYNGLVDMGYKKHFWVHHGEHEFARGNCHINGIESFWSYAKRRLAKFNAFPRQTFLLHIKECEFRFHHREEDLSDRMLNSTERNPL